MAKIKGDILERLVPVLLVVTIALAFLVGVLWQKVNNLSRGTSSSQVTTQLPESGNSPSVNGKLSESQAKNLPQVTSEDHVRGDRSAKVFLIEYSDLECPFCASFHPTAQQALDEYGGQLAWVYRHFPLDAIHANARPAAEASECVAETGGEETFWAFADSIFENQSRLSDLPGVATSVGVSKSAFDSCFEAGRYTDRVESDYQEGLTAGVTGTPGNFLVNDKGEAWYIPGAIPYESLKVTIDEALQS